VVALDLDPPVTDAEGRTVLERRYLDDLGARAAEDLPERVPVRTRRATASARSSEPLLTAPESP